jgi:hypothetical protein
VSEPVEDRILRAPSAHTRPSSIACAPMHPSIIRPPIRHHPATDRHIRLSSAHPPSHPSIIYPSTHPSIPSTHRRVMCVYMSRDYVLTQLPAARCRRDKAVGGGGLTRLASLLYLLSCFTYSMEHYANPRSPWAENADKHCGDIVIGITAALAGLVRTCLAVPHCPSIINPTKTPPCPLSAPAGFQRSPLKKPGPLRLPLLLVRLFIRLPALDYSLPIP